jgi:hypothetical protein
VPSPRTGKPQALLFGPRRGSEGPPLLECRRRLSLEADRRCHDAAPIEMLLHRGPIKDLQLRLPGRVFATGTPAAAEHERRRYGPTDTPSSACKALKPKPATPFSTRKAVIAPVRIGVERADEQRSASGGSIQIFVPQA